MLFSLNFLSKIINPWRFFVKLSSIILAKSMKFYQAAFGWTFNKWEGPIEYWFSQSSNPNELSIDGAIAKKTKPNETVVDTIGVENLDDIIRKIKDQGGKITNPKHAIPGVGWLVYFQDPDGNIFGIMQNDKNAK